MWYEDEWIKGDKVSENKTVRGTAWYEDTAESAIAKAISSVRLNLMADNLCGHQWVAYGVDVTQTPNGFSAGIELYDFDKIQDFDDITIIEDDEAQALNIASGEDARAIAAQILEWLGPEMDPV